MEPIESLYTGALYVARAASPLLGFGAGKLARGIRGRRGAVERVEAWAARHRDPSRPLAWFHAPSVGEGLQARAVIEAIRETRPDAQIAYTYFSPSAEPFARKSPVDVADYLPVDLPGPMTRMLEALRPGVVAFTKTEIWPNLTRLAVERSVAVVLLSATLPEGSSRLRGSARALLGAAHRRLSTIAAISPEDARRYGAFAVDPARVTVMGDARFDQVEARTRNPLSDPALLDALTDADRVTIVAGSTWPPDDERLIEAFARLAAEDGPACRLILVPHEPSDAHVEGAEARLREAGLSSTRLSRSDGGGFDRQVLVVDRVGILGDLYRLADVAYVGGGFGDAGLHSVLEPAAFGVPVVFGPRHTNAREAAELAAAGGARSVADAAELFTVLEEWVRDPGARSAAGACAREYVARGLGAAERGARILAAWLG